MSDYLAALVDGGTAVDADGYYTKKDGLPNDFMLVGSSVGLNTKTCKNTEDFPLDPENLKFGENELRSLVFNLVNPLEPSEDKQNGIKKILSGFVNLSSVTIESLEFSRSEKKEVSLEYIASGCFSTSGNIIQIKATNVPDIKNNFWDGSIKMPVDVTSGDLTSTKSKISKKLDFWNFGKSMAFEIILDCDKDLIPSSLDAEDMPVSNFIRARFLWGVETIENGQEKLRNYSQKKATIFGVYEPLLDTMMIKTDYFEVRTHMDIRNQVIYQNPAYLDQKNLPKIEFLNSELNGLKEATIIIPDELKP